MNSNPILADLLHQLKLAALAPKLSRGVLLSAIENLLRWLNQPENNTDNNCKQIDYFISSEIIPEKKFEEIPENIRDILFDMGTTLHDTHISADIAKNFQSTPDQLIARVQNIHKDMNKLSSNKE